VFALPGPREVRVSRRQPKNDAQWIGRLAAIGATTVVVVFLVLEVPMIWSGFAADPAAIGGDFHLYVDRTRSFLAGDGFYLPRQLAGPYFWAVGDAFYPPTAILLFAPFLVLPAVFWWAIPVAIVVGVIAWHRPALWSWPLLVACIAWPFTVSSFLFGNPAIWIAALVALGTVLPVAGPFVLLKPSLAPFALAPLALAGTRSRGWWIGSAVLALVSVAFLPLWIEWIQVITDAHLPIDYSFHDMPICLIGIVAAMGGTWRPSIMRLRVRPVLAATGLSAP